MAEEKRYELIDDPIARATVEDERLMKYFYEQWTNNKKIRDLTPTEGKRGLGAFLFDPFNVDEMREILAKAGYVGFE